MLFYYPKNAKIVKDIDRFTYLTYAAMSVNLNRLNNDSSNTYKIVEIGAQELLRTSYDLQYLPTFPLDNIDFVAIDRINRFNISMISNLDMSDGSSVFANNCIIGYSLYTNKNYELLNCNSFTDFTRHSIPCDAFLQDGASSINYTDISITLQPNIKNVFAEEFIVNRSKVTISILDYDISKWLLMPEPFIEITGIDINYNTVTEEIKINSAFDLISKNEYISISSMLLTGLSEPLYINVLPYLVCKTASIEYEYVDREDYFTVNVKFSLNKDLKKLNISKLNDSAIYPAQLETYEEIDLNMPDTYEIDNYHFDENNRLLYVIAKDSLARKYLYIYTIVIPKPITNIAKAISSETQNVKVDYIRDTINQQYVLTIFPANKSHRVETLNIAVIFPHKVARGLWYSSTSYTVGDLVLFGGSGYICTVGHTSGETFDLGKFVAQKEYVTQNFLLDLISYGVETNKFTVPFSTIFKIDKEAIISIETIGDDVCYTQILAQNHSLYPIVNKSIQSLISYYSEDDIPLNSNIVYPLVNMNGRLLSEKMNTYDNIPFPNINIQSTIFNVFSLTSSNYININNYEIVNVFNSFYLDWDNRNIITSDTITHILNEDITYGVMPNVYGSDTITQISDTDFQREFTQ